MALKDSIEFRFHLSNLLFHATEENVSVTGIFKLIIIYKSERQKALNVHGFYNLKILILSRKLNLFSLTRKQLSTFLQTSTGPNAGIL